MKDRVCSDALVIPSNTGCATAGRSPSASNDAFELANSSTVDLLADQECAVTSIRDLNLLQHLANNHLDVLVVDFHTLQAINVLDFLEPDRPPAARHPE